MSIPVVLEVIGATPISVPQNTGHRATALSSLMERGGGATSQRTLLGPVIGTSIMTSLS